jgi:hypothetical protein
LVLYQDGGTDQRQRLRRGKLGREASLPAWIVASALVLRRDLSGLRGTRRYVLAHMPPAAQAVRLLGQITAWRAAYRHRPGGILIGVLVIVAGWSFGPLSRVFGTSRGT